MTNQNDQEFHKAHLHGAPLLEAMFHDFLRHQDTTEQLDCEIRLTQRNGAIMTIKLRPRPDQVTASRLFPGYSYTIVAINVDEWQCHITSANTGLANDG